MTGPAMRWRRFRISPSWFQILLWVVFTPVPLLLMAVTRRRARLWATAALVTVVWLGAIAIGAEHAPAVADAAADRPRFWAGAGMVVALLAVLYSIVAVLPTRLVSPADLTKEQLLKARNDVRSGLFAALGGAVALGGAFIGGYVGLKQLDVGRRQVDVNREGQITERFSRAIDQLGSQAVDIRVGGIYTLERIARNSAADHGPIMEVLTAFVRQHGRPPTGAASDNKEANTDPAPGNVSARPRADLQAILTVLGRRVRDYDRPDGRLDLTEIHVPDALLKGVDLYKADFAQANLQRADFSGAKLQRANFYSAELQGAILHEADLFDADLNGAKLADAGFLDADLREASFLDADLQRAFLSANLQKAELSRADLREALLVDADVQHASLSEADLRGAILQGTIFVGADLEGAKLGEADLRGANLEGASLAGAKLEGALADGETRWPAGFDPKAAGVIME